MTNSTQESEGRSIDSQRMVFAVRMLLIGVVALTLLAQPVAAQSGSDNPVCGKDGMDTITGIVEGWVKLTAGLGLMGMIGAWQGDALAEMVANTPESRKKLKRHKRSVGKSGLTLIVLGPVATIAGQLMGLPITQCVNLVPF